MGLCFQRTNDVSQSIQRRGRLSGKFDYFILYSKFVAVRGSRFFIRIFLGRLSVSLCVRVFFEPGFVPL